jgi:hypothetical protein
LWNETRGFGVYDKMKVKLKNGSTIYFKINSFLSKRDPRLIRDYFCGSDNGLFDIETNIINRSPFETENEFRERYKRLKATK